MSASVSENGTLVYAQGGYQETQQLTWFDRAGRVLSTLGDAAPYLNLALSPDERRVAVALRTGNPENVDIWIHDIARNIRSRVTLDPGSDRSPVWSPNGTRIVFAGQRPGKAFLRQQLIDGAAADESLFEVSDGLAPTSWSADGRFIAYTLGGTFPRTSDVWVLPLFGDRKPFPLVQTELFEAQAVFSPDGRWVAYAAADPRGANVYVQSFPEAGAKVQVSRDGGSHPGWRADGKELFYLADDGTMMAVPIAASAQFNAGSPQTLFPTGLPVFNIPPSVTVYAVTKDGKRFLVNAIPQQAGATPLTVLVNWTSAIQK